MFYSVGIFRTSSLGGSISSNPEKTALSRQEGEPGCIGVLQQKAGSRNIKRLLLIKENHTPFCVWEGARVWAHWNYSFDMHLSYLGPCALYPEFPQGSHWRAAIADDCDILCLLIWQEISHFSISSCIMNAMSWKIIYLLYLLVHRFYSCSVGTVHLQYIILESKPHVRSRRK